MVSRFVALCSALAALSACAPVPPRETEIVAGIQATSPQWGANQVFANNIAFQQPVKKTRFSNSLEIALKNVGWYSAFPNANYKLSYELQAEQPPKQFIFGSEGKLWIRYILKDKNNKELMNKTMYSSAKLGLSESLTGADGVSKVVETYANANLKELFAVLATTVGGALYDQQQAEMDEQKTIKQFDIYDLFSDSSFFESSPYSSMSYTDRTKLFKSTKSTWIMKLKSASAKNCQKFLSIYGAYLDPNEKTDVNTIIDEKKIHPVKLADKPPERQTKVPVVEHKNPF